ncbi:MAG: hypothetical protein IJ899_14795 [Blautia sp.]|nr:hypothetical protein [Blautia sp.]
MSVRSDFSKRSKWWLSKHRFLELYHYCLQYREWKAELESLDGRRAVGYDAAPGGGGESSDPTYNLARRRAELEEKILNVEECAYEADGELAKYILLGVTDDSATYNFMDKRLNIPCGKNTYYDRRRKFYYLLDKKSIN